MNCIIVDDEPLARQLLESYIQQIDELTLLKSCKNAIEALALLERANIDLILMDIDMPVTSGIELLKSLQVSPHVIFTTAYREYALDAYDLDVVDYLLKPINFNRFLHAIAKIKQLKQYEPEKVVTAHSRYEDTFLFLKENREMKKIFLKDILFIESLRDYVRVKTITQEVISYQKISYLEQRLPQQKFIRVHRSFIVPVERVSAFTQSSVKVDSTNIPIGRNYKNATLSLLKKRSMLHQLD